MTVNGMTQPRFLHPRFNHPCECFPDIEEILRDPSANHWLKIALTGALSLNSADVAEDAEVLMGVLRRWADHQIRDHSHCD
jgi:hypothetical protein